MEGRGSVSGGPKTGREKCLAALVLLPSPTVPLRDGKVAASSDRTVPSGRVATKFVSHADPFFVTARCGPALAGMSLTQIKSCSLP